MHVDCSASCPSWVNTQLNGLDPDGSLHAQAALVNPETLHSSPQKWLMTRSGTFCCFSLALSTLRRCACSALQNLHLPCLIHDLTAAARTALTAVMGASADMQRALVIRVTCLMSHRHAWKLLLQAAQHQDLAACWRRLPRNHPLQSRKHLLPQNAGIPETGAA